MIKMWIYTRIWVYKCSFLVLIQTNLRAAIAPLQFTLGSITFYIGNMVIWIFYSLLAAMLWAVVNVVDRYTMVKLVDSPLLPVLVLSCINLVAAVAIFCIKGLVFFTHFDLFVAYCAGLFYVLTMLFYYLALKNEEVSTVIPIYYLSPVFILFIAHLFLNEIFTTYQYIGIAFLVSGAILISMTSYLTIKISKGTGYILLAAFCYALNQVLTKYLVTKNDFWFVFAYIRVGVFLSLLPVFGIKFVDIRKNHVKNGCRVYGIITINQLLNLLGVMAITLAMTNGYVTLVNAIAAIQPLFVFLLITSLGFCFPSVLKETLDYHVLVKKFAATLCIIIGVLIIG